MDSPLRVVELKPQELGRIADIDVSESGDCVYRWVDGRVTAVPEQWTRGPRDWTSYISEIRQTIAAGGAAIAAVVDGRVVGVCVMRDRLTPGVAELAGLWVDSAHRRRGVARLLVRQGIDRARSQGARSVYVSATPSRSAVGFYSAQGFQPTPYVHRERFLREPEDIHMLLEL